MALRLARELTLIIGPCGVGKTTYARAHYPDDAQPDREALIRACLADGVLRYYNQARAVSARLQQIAVADFLARGVAVCLTISGATRQERAMWVDVGRQSGVTVHGVRLVADEGVCLARAKADLTRPASSKGKWAKIIHHWFTRYEPVVNDPVEGFNDYQEVMW